MLKPKKIIDKYLIKKHQAGNFYIVEVFHLSNENFLRQRKLKDCRNLSLTEAESRVYKLENKIKWK